MPDIFPPALIFIAAAIVLPVLPKGNLRALFLLAVPLVAAHEIWQLSEGVTHTYELLGYSLTLMRVDQLSIVFGLIFSFAAFLALLYAWHVKDTVQQVTTLLYAGSAIGAVFAGDFVTLFIFWEGTAVASVFLIWARGTEGAYYTGMRYLIIQIASGVILVAGMALHYHETGSLAFGALTLGSLGTWAILIAFGIKAAFPLLHTWLPDAYPAATPTGTVVLSIFTTKLAIYSLARSFAGTEILIYIGTVMVFWPLIYAAAENDLRRVLAYALNNQLGFMVIAVGIGTPLALNGVAAHAVAHILYKSLLFMAMGAVLYRTGTAKASGLGGLYRSMPITALLCIVGGLAMSTPLFAGFVSKSLILSSVAKAYEPLIWAALLFGSAGIFYVAGVRLPYLAFFGEDKFAGAPERPKEAPWNMLLAMGLTAASCFALGLMPATFMSFLPYDVAYDAYTPDHILTQLQVLSFTAIAFFALWRFGLIKRPAPGILVDSDWLNRRLALAIVKLGAYISRNMWGLMSRTATRRLDAFLASIYRAHGPQGPLARSWPAGSMVLWIAVLLGFTLILSFSQSL
ncbi:NADH dehydrogenase subunit N [Tepidicaulis marinus]|uniref:NADH dehydrogenase subunit N n=1 Tax=Tepidicaulis marinus TaxID=1333998 RepID=A0A081B7P3_9HYPH|nr:Na(+)/H(+) antiporter subunit D [Tepidicaulis marinus]GAK44061.1 NADH dehydrogenase subunit N [Tepidicaulis marinus]